MPPPAPPPALLSWLRPGALTRRLVLAEVLGPPRAAAWARRSAGPAVAPPGPAAPPPGPAAPPAALPEGGDPPRRP